MKAIRIYPIRPVAFEFAECGNEYEECPPSLATEYAVYAVEELQTHLDHFASLAHALHLAETLSTLFGVPLEDAHNLKGI